MRGDAGGANRGSLVYAHTLAIMRSNGVGSSLLSERAVEPEYVYMYDCLGTTTQIIRTKRNHKLSNPASSAAPKSYATQEHSHRNTTGPAKEEH